MRLFYALMLLALSACVPAKPVLNTSQLIEIGGVMVGETVLDGDYLLVTDLLIPEGSRLVIKPGTTIMVRRAELTKIDPEFLSSMTELLVRGTLLIEGTANAPVVIAPEKPASPGDPAWAGLLLDNVGSSSVQNARISGAETGLLLVAADIVLADCMLEQNRYGLVIQGGSPLLERNRITAGEGGLFIWRDATPLLNENVISRNEEEGIYVDRSSKPQFIANRSEQNAIGLVADFKPAREDLQLIDNGEAWRTLPDRQVAK